MCLATINKAAVELVTHPSTGWQGCLMPRFWFFSPAQFVSFSFVTGEGDNYPPLGLFPFLVSSGQSLPWIKFQRMFLWKTIRSWQWQSGRGETIAGFYFHQVQPSAKAKFSDCLIDIENLVISTNWLWISNCKTALNFTLSCFNLMLTTSLCQVHLPLPPLEPVSCSGLGGLQTIFNAGLAWRNYT